MNSSKRALEPKDRSHHPDDDLLLAATIDVLPEALSVFDRDGRIVRTNDASRALLSVSANDAILTKTLSERMQAVAMRDSTGTALARDRWPVTRILRGERLAGDDQNDVLVRDRAGHDVRLNPTGNAVRDAQGAIIGGVIVYRDVTAHRAAAKASADREAHFREITDTAPVLIWMTDTNALHTYFNQTWLTFTGRTLEQEQGKGWLDGVHADDVQRCLDAHLSAFTGRHDFTLHYRLKRHDGQHRWMLARGVVRFDANGTFAGHIGSCIDLTDSKDADATHDAILAEAVSERQQLTTLLGVLPAGVAIYDSAGGLLQQNAAGERITGRADHSHDLPVVRQSRYGMRRPDGTPLPEPETPSGRARRGETFTDLACLIAGPDGEDIALLTSGAPLPDEHGTIVGAVVVFQDVTPLRVLERRTHASLDALLRLAQSAVGAGEDLGTVSHAIAKVTREVLGCARVGVMAIVGDEQYVMPLAVEGLSPEDEERWWAMQPRDVRYGEGGDPAQVARFAAGEEAVLDFTQPPLDQMPNPFGITTALFVPMRLDGRLVGFISLDYANEQHQFSASEIALAHGVADLAALMLEREHLQAAHAESQARALALAETNTRMHTFLGIASHELRTPVTSIKTSVQLAGRVMRSALGTDMQPELAARVERATTQLDRVNRQADRLNRLIADLLDVTRIRSDTLDIHLSRLDLVPLVVEAVEQLRLEWPNREITMAVSPTAAMWVMGDDDRLSQVIANLVTNALKYSPTEKPIALVLDIDDHLARLAVIDQGPGLTDDQQTHLFSAFSRIEGIETLSGSSVGLGLGLFICKTIMQHHAGTLGVTSIAGEGATFWVTLPLIGAE